MLILHRYQCRDCGHIFLHGTGGFILQISVPQCPKCGSQNVKKIESSK